MNKNIQPYRRVWRETMNGNLVIFICIGICVMILIGLLFEKQIVTLLINGVSGVVVMYCINSILPAYAIGINLLTIGTVTLLGLPGVVTLYIIKLII